jgi:transposase
VVHLRLLGLSAAKVADFLEEAHGVRLSTAAVLQLERWAAEALGDLYEVLKAEVRKAPVVGADETKFRIAGENGWMWVFTHLNAVVNRVAPSRGPDVVEEFLSGSRGTLVHDGWLPYEVITTAQHQLDLCHVNRWRERAEVLHRIEPRPLLKFVEAKRVGPGHPPTEFLEFADGVRWIVRNAIEWTDEHPDAPRSERMTFYRGVRWDMADHLRREWRDPDAARVAGELWKRRDMLFTFLIEPGVPWHNNGAETEIRQGVLYRKLSGGRRSWTGARVLERLLTIYRTCRKRELDFLSVVREAIAGNGYPAFGPPSAPARNLS